MPRKKTENDKDDDLDALIEEITVLAIVLMACWSGYASITDPSYAACMVTGSACGDLIAQKKRGRFSTACFG